MIRGVLDGRQATATAWAQDKVKRVPNSLDLCIVCISYTFDVSNLSLCIRYIEQIIIAEAHAGFEEIGAYTLIAGYLQATGTRALLLALSQKPSQRVLKVNGIGRHTADML